MNQTINTKPKEGDYVIINADTNSPRLNDYIKNNIGKIISIYQDKDPNYNKFNLVPPDIIKVIYTNIPEEMRSWFIGDFFQLFNIHQVVASSKNKKELETILAANKYNL